MQRTPTHPARRLTRSLTAGLGLIAIGLSACSSGEEESASPAEASTIDYAYAGYEAVLPAEPERVLVLDSRTALEFSLLADYPIVAADYDPDSHLAGEVDDQVAHLENAAFEPDLEEIASYDPDLIVIGAGWWDVYVEDELALDEVAPVLVVRDASSAPADGGGGDDATSFQMISDQLTLLGRERKAQEAIEDYETTLASAQEELADLDEDRTASVVVLDSNNFQVITDDSIFQEVLPALGYTILEDEDISAAPPNEGGSYHLLSYESALSALEVADLLLVQNADGPGSENAGWLSVPAIEEERWAPLDYANRTGFALTYAGLVEDIVAASDSLRGWTTAPWRPGIRRQSGTG